VTGELGLFDMLSAVAGEPLASVVPAGSAVLTRPVALPRLPRVELPDVSARALPAEEAAPLQPWIRAAFGRGIMEESCARGANPGLVAEVLAEVGLPVGRVAGHAQA